MDKLLALQILTQYTLGTFSLIIGMSILLLVGSSIGLYKAKTILSKILLGLATLFSLIALYILFDVNAHIWVSTYNSISPEFVTNQLARTINALGYQVDFLNFGSVLLMFIEFVRK